MARIRTIKPEFWQDERLATLPRDVRLLFVGLWNISDDYGRLRGHPSFIKGQVFPYDDDVDVPGWLGLLEGLGRVVRYERDGQSFIWIRKFSEHQKMDKRTDSKLPEPTAEEMEAPAQKQSEPAEEKALEWKGKEQGKEGKGKEALASAAPAPPPPKENFPRVPEKPTKDDGLWDGMDLWAWIQAKRWEVGLACEKRPNERAVSAWYSAAQMEGVPIGAMREAFYAFAEDPHWKDEKRRPALPFAGFMSQMAKFLPQGAVNAA